VKEGKSSIALVSGEVMRTVIVIALRLYFPKGDKFLINLCDYCHDTGTFIHKAVLPGTKKRPNETWAGSSRRILENELSTVAKDVNIYMDMVPTKTATVKDSDTYGLRTRYLRTTFNADLTIDIDTFPAIEVPRTASREADRARSCLDILHAPGISSDDRLVRSQAVCVLSTIMRLHRLEQGAVAAPMKKSRLSMRRSENSSKHSQSGAKVTKLYAWVTQDEFSKLTHPQVAPILREWCSALEFKERVSNDVD